MAKGTLYIISAPSGAGKTTLVQAVTDLLPNVEVSVSHTTRTMRTGEKDGENYYFVSEQEFTEMVAAGEFLEHARVFGNYYGTSRQHIQEQLLTGKDVILEIDWQGARQIRPLETNNRSIFILPPSIAELRKRLEVRAQDSEEVINSRMKNAVGEMSHYGEFDYIVINDQLERATQDMASIFICNRLSREFQQQKHADLLAELLTTEH